MGRVEILWGRKSMPVRCACDVVKTCGEPSGNAV
nr:MAG TPA: hypothetical protein [Caudoviricetes sp.]